MNVLLSNLPLVIAGYFAFAVLRSAYALWRHPHHPLGLFTRSLSAASMIGIAGVVGLLPSALWWAVWLVALLFVIGLVRAVLRLLREAPTEPTASDDDAHRSKHLAAPSRITVASESVIFALVAAAGVLAG